MKTGIITTPDEKGTLSNEHTAPNPHDHHAPRTDRQGPAVRGRGLRRRVGGHHGHPRLGDDRRRPRSDQQDQEQGRWDRPRQLSPGPADRVSRSRCRRRDERGASAVELALYMPLLMLVILIAVQFSLNYLGNAAASAVAREAARVARISGDRAAGELAGYQYAANVGRGVLVQVDVQVVPVGDRMRAVVTGKAQEVSPLFVPGVRQTVEGPLEEFKVDQ
ncbi:pilus assembly protein [Nocardioides iriomotensis]|uniref:Pilus assembly protein n=1 Tax=Nocardioides iriomotensis TaxID=715784 RepID=A0A4Q5J5D9_9ACTN|nr:pilus assembly protein [Nocardioides iriomotensis]